MTDPIFIQSRTQLARACERWLTTDAIGLDTEFERTRTYYSRPALVQVFDGQRATLIDPLGIDDFAPLARLLEDPGVTKVMHAAEGDVEVLEQLTHVTPGPIFDTQMAAAFTGHGFSLGYRMLVERLLGERIAKDETRSDWLRRPLSEAQIAYAVLDVLYLLPMYRQLGEELESLGRTAWFVEETERVRERREVDRDPDRAYLRIRQGRRLTGGSVGVLRALAAWREREARDRDRPRQMILRDESLVAIAAAMPGDEAQLATLGALSDKARRRYADTLLEIIRLAGNDHAMPAPVVDRSQTATLKALKDVLKHRAEELGLPAPLLAQSRTLEALVVAAAAGAQELPEELRGWRQNIVGDRLMSELRRMTTQAP